MSDQAVVDGDGEDDVDSAMPVDLHPGVICDGCYGDVRGIRFKCSVCPDFDICRNCEQQGTHPHHDMLIIKRPGDIPVRKPITGEKPSQHMIIEDKQKNQSVTPFDRNWSPPVKGIPFHRHLVDPKSAEYQEVIDNITQNGASRWTSRIKAIHRIENYKQYSVYMSCKEEMDNENEKNFQNERILWHGTSRNVLDEIYRSGFNRSYCGKNATAFGDGVYFAANFEYSTRSNYSPPDQDGVKYIFQCRVLTGHFTTGSPGLKEPPMRNTELRYDSVVDDQQPPSMFVIFKDMQTYPEYIISIEIPNFMMDIHKHK